MEAAQIPWRPIGELFVEKNLITKEQLEEALAEQAATGRRLGEILVERNLISSPELTQALMEQLGREVAKEEGFGTGLWSEIRRRNAPVGSTPAPATEEADRPPFGVRLTRKLGVVSGGGSELAEEMDPDGLEAHRQLMAPAETDPVDLPETDVLSSASEQARSEFDAGEQGVAGRARRVTELEPEIELLRATPATNGNAQADDVGVLEHALASARDELHVRWARIDELESTLLRREARIEELEATLGRLDGRASEAADPVEAERLEHELSSTRGRLAELEGALAAEQDAHGETRGRLDEAAGAEREARAALDEIGRGLGSLQVERDAAHAEASAAAEALTAREHELAVVHERLAAAGAALAAEREGHAETRRKAEQAAAEAGRAGAALDELEKHRAEFEERSRRLEEDLASTSADTSRHQEQLAEAERRSAELNAQITSLSAQLAAVEAALDEAKDGCKIARREAEHANARLQEAEGRIAELSHTETKLAEAEQRIAELSHTETKLAEAEQRIAELHHTETKLAEAEQRIAELDHTEAKLAEAEHRIAELSSADAQLHDAEKRIAELANVETKLAEAEQRITEMSAALNRSDAERAELSRSRANDRAPLERKLAALEARLAEESAAHAETRCVLAQALADLTVRAPTTAVGNDSEPATEDYLCFAPTADGYRLLVRTGMLPAAGDEYDVDGVVHLVTRVARSPLPFDSRTCVYLLAAPDRPADA
jgi:chromosome segregation ATPase